VKTRSNLAEYSKKVYGSKRAVLPVMIYSVYFSHWQNSKFGERVGILVAMKNANICNWAEFEPAIQAFSRRKIELALNLTAIGISRP
jgi:hypothetical protein